MQEEEEDEIEEEDSQESLIEDSDSDSSKEIAKNSKERDAELDFIHREDSIHDENEDN